MGKPANLLRRRVLGAIDRHKPDRKCRCEAWWCDKVGVVKVGARWYCAETGRILSEPSASALVMA